MELNQEIICLPPKDDEIRFAIGKKGKRNLLCVGINPNTADSDRLDPTSRNVEKIALNNGYDGWILVNLYPKREKNVSLLEIQPNEKLFWENLNLIKTLVRKNQFGFDKVWLAWGNDIDSFNQVYLKESAYHLFNKLAEFELDYVSAGTNKSGNPTHPSPQAIAKKFRDKANDVKLTKFDFKTYVSKIKGTIKISPEITIDGIEFK